jgi:hypothetical protein
MLQDVHGGEAHGYVGRLVEGLVLVLNAHLAAPQRSRSQGELRARAGRKARRHNTVGISILGMVGVPYANDMSCMTTGGWANKGVARR